MSERLEPSVQQKLADEICSLIKSKKVSIIEAEDVLAVVNERLRLETKAFGE